MTIDFRLEPEQVAARDGLRRYLDKEVAPLVDTYEAGGQVVPRPIVAAMREFGLLGGLLPESLGGLAMPMTTYGTLIAEVARVWPSLRSVLSITNLAASVLAEAGTPSAIARHLPALLSGERLGCFALSEPNIGSDAANIETRATRDGADWVITGRKLYISIAPICDVGVVFVSTSRDDGRNGVSCLLFDRHAPGVHVTPLPKMGMHSCPLGEVLFDGVRVPADHLVGEAHKGFALAKKYLNAGRCVVAFSALGIAEASLEAAIRFAGQRVQFGKPIGSFQLVQQMIADMMTLVETSRLLSYRAADAIDRDAPDQQLLCSMAKRQTTDAVLRVAEMALQVHGGAGYTTLFPVERHYRDARHLSIAEGTNQIQSMLIAQHALGLSALR